MIYGFVEPFQPDFPSQVIIDLTEVCNLACIHCPHPAFKRGPHYAARYLNPTLNAKAVDEVAAHSPRVQYIRYTSDGEPLVHPAAYDMIQYAVDNSRTFVTLTTNGTVMDERRTKRLLDTGIQMIDISIDAATSGTYSRVRKGDYERVSRNVARLLKWARQGRGTKVVVSFVEQPENTHEVEQFRHQWEPLGATVVIRRLHSAAGGVQKIKWDLMERAPDRYPCVYPWERITLKPNGQLAFCPQDWENGSNLGDYATTTIAETWDSPAYRRLRHAHIVNDFRCHKFCGGCPDWASTRWPGQGESYRDLVDQTKGDEK